MSFLWLQGYALTMQQGFTQLRKLGFSMDKLRDIGTTSTGHVTLDKDGEIIGRTGRDRWGSADKDVKRFNIQLPRQSLRHELLSSLPGDMVQWGKKLLSIAPDSKTISFTDGTTTNYDLLVDASGIWSQFVAHHPLSYLGVIVILGRGRVVTKNDLMLGVDKIWQTVDGVTRMYAMPFGIEGETMWQLSWKCSEEMAKELGSDSTRLLSAAKSRVEGWHDPWTELLNSTSLDDVTGT
jgi:2-polyprenyl-6-methoxyphenol hydroxylase-like FAD-dependent oxidoreductase